MSLKRSVSQSIILLIIITACSSTQEHSFEASYYEKSEQKWLSTISKLGYDGTNLQNHVLLAIHATECAPCLQELAWWNSQGKDQIEAEVSLLVIERHESVFNSFLKAEQITLPAFQDSSASLFKQKLIPTTPVKLYFNKAGHISAMDYMGTGGDIQAFLKKIEDI